MTVPPQGRGRGFVVRAKLASLWSARPRTRPLYGCRRGAARPGVESSMRRAIAVLALLLAFAALDAPRTRAETNAVMNGIGLIDYGRKPDFKIGDWVRYHLKSKSELGATDDYEITVLIAGEEDFWGDPGFWVETSVDMPGLPTQTRAALVSYEIFGDSVATQRLLLYTRKMISMLNDDGSAKMDINKPSASTFKALKVLMKQGTGATQSVGDSSIYTEVRENRTSWYTLDVPITHLAREDIESINAHKSWLIGRSGDATPLAIRDRGLGSARLIDFGHGATGRVVPKRLQRTIAEQVAAENAAAKPASSTKSSSKTSAAGTKPQ